MKQTIIAITLALLLLSACVQVETQTQPTGQVVQPAEKAVVKIGATLPLTGDVAFLGEGARQGMELALSELKDTKFTYKLIFEDDKIDPKLASTAATKLMTVDNVDAILSLSSGTGNVVTPLAEENKVIHFGIASDANIAKGIFNFIHWTPPDEEVRVWVKEAQNRGIKKVAVFSVQQQGELAIAEELKKQGPAFGVEVVDEQIFPAGEKDFRTMLIKARQAKPDIFMLLAFSPEIDILYKQMKEMGVKEPVTSIEAFELTDDPAQFEGNWYVNGADFSGKFQSNFEKKYGKMPILGTANAYDILKLMVEGFERAGTDSSVKPSPEAVASALIQVKDFDGALGKLSIGETGIVWSPASVRIIQDGKPVTLK